KASRFGLRASSVGNFTGVEKCTASQMREELSRRSAKLVGKKLPRALYCVVRSQSECLCDPLQFTFTQIESLTSPQDRTSRQSADPYNYREQIADEKKPHRSKQRAVLQNQPSHTPSYCQSHEYCDYE